MEIYILDKLLRPVDVVDEFFSILWSERYSEMGDFELVVSSTPNNRRRFVGDTWLTVTNSKAIMAIDSIEEMVDETRGLVLRIKGKDGLSLLEKRSALNTSLIDPEVILPNWSLTGWTAAEIARVMFWSICVEGEVSSADIIPFMQWGGGAIDEGPSLYPESTIPEPPENISWEQKPDTLYNAIKGICTTYDLGFRLYKDPNSSKLYFNIYAGSDRTSAQTTLMPVIFSPDTDSLNNTNELTDLTKNYNAIRVIYPYKNLAENDVTATVMVTDPNVSSDPNFGGLDRKVKILMVSSIPEDVEPVDWLDYLWILGWQELMNSRPVGVFDGEVDLNNTQYVFERDYFLGDLVEVRSSTGGTAFMRVEEHIRAEDGSGERSYPSLVTKEYINPGTWASWKYDVEWTAMGSGEFWDNQ